MAVSKTNQLVANELFRLTHAHCEIVCYVTADSRQVVWCGEISTQSIPFHRAMGDAMAGVPRNDGLT